ncbi:MAG TPA: AAA family ATPase [Thermoanaerobaculia bacterium]|nr:AAA family ATPase [Thermoanaerobaculia bacterium]
MNPKPYLRSIELNRESIESFEEFPFSVPVVRELDRLEFHPDVTFFVGENGSGKSTLIEAIALGMGFGAAGGTRNVRFETTESRSRLSEHLKLVRSIAKPEDYYFLRAESFYNVATYMDSVGYLGGYGGQSLHERSHGEAFLATLNTKLRGKGFYLFDEPEAALSPQRQLTALAAIHQLVENDSQLIIATHLPILMAYPSAKIVLFDETGLREIAYEETENYAVTRDFLNHRERMLHHLLEDEDD